MKPQEQDRPAQGDPLDETIVHVERLYRTLTGRDVPPVGDTPFAPIPPSATRSSTSASRWTSC